jgi:FAD/FMN-containing dehydrogenase
MLEFVAVWEKQDSTNGQIHQQWVRDLSASLITDALAGGYPNILGPDEHQQISKAYGENLERLQQIKSKYDPSNMFKAISIPFSK